MSSLKPCPDCGREPTEEWDGGLEYSWGWTSCCCNWGTDAVTVWDLKVEMKPPGCCDFSNYDDAKTELARKWNAGNVYRLDKYGCKREPEERPAWAINDG